MLIVSLPYFLLNLLQSGNLWVMSQDLGTDAIDVTFRHVHCSVF